MIRKALPFPGGRAGNHRDTQSLGNGTGLVRAAVVPDHDGRMGKFPLAVQNHFPNGSLFILTGDQDGNGWRFFLILHLHR